MDAQDRKAIMEKLEKALEKVKQQRGTGVPNMTVDRVTVDRVTIERDPSPAEPPADELPLSAPERIAPPLKANVLPHPSSPPAPNLVTVNEAHLEKHRILAHHSRSPEADIFRILRTQVLQIMNKSGFRTLAITSPNYGDGKTTIALNLATSIALDLKQTVLLIDLDLRKPNLYEYMGMDPTVGLSNYLLHNTPLNECMVRPSFDRLNTLPAGPAIDYSSEILGSPKMAALSQELKARYPDRMIIYDMPPVLAQDDSSAFMPHVEAVLMVVRDGVTRTDEVRQCLERLSNANVIGVVLNDAKDEIRRMPKQRRKA